MDIEIYKLVLIAVVVLAATFTQTITGFGFGIVAMIFLPSFLLYTESNILSAILSTITSLLIVLVLLKHVNWKNIIFPLLGSTVTNYLAVSFMKNTENEILILILGIVLFLLSIYFFLFSDKVKIRPTWYSGLIAGLISGVMGGLFSISGPPVVVYSIQSEDNVDKYLATISAYFVLSGIITIITKAISGFMTTNVWLGLAVGIVCLIIGSFAGKFARNKANPNLIKKLVYGVMATSGLIHVITSLI